MSSLFVKALSELDLRAPLLQYFYVNFEKKTDEKAI